MTATKYTYSILNDFNNNISFKNLHSEVQNEPGITSATFQYIESVDDAVYIWFDNPITSAEQNILNILVSNHYSIEPVIYTYVTQLEVINKEVSTDTYMVVASFTFPGNNLKSNIANIKCKTKMDDELTSYSIRCYDATNIQVLEEKTGLTNTNEQIIDLNNLTNLPTNEAEIEIQIKKVGKDEKVKIKKIDVYFS